MKSQSDATVRALRSMSEITRADWDACANPGWDAPAADDPVAGRLARPLAEDLRADCKGAATAQTEIQGTAFNPFLSHDFLWSLEESGAATGKTGWLAQHLVLDGADGKPAAIMPCYLKSHSMGEYVFDHGWADAYERAGGRYYPKLQASVPFTPVPARSSWSSRGRRPSGSSASLPRRAWC